MEESINEDVKNEKRPLAKKIDNQELRSSGFWLNQVFMIVSTIVGVYLAAQSGLEQALTFDTYSKMEDNYYLRMSLYDELSDNVTDLDAYVDEFLARSRPLQEIKDFRPPMDRYIWKTMQYNPTTLETPSVILTETRRFYSQADMILNKAERRALGAAYAGKELKKLTENMKQNTLPSIKFSANMLKDELSKNGVEIGILKEAGK